jgi:UrcA family protein
MRVMHRPTNKFVIPGTVLAVLLSPLGGAATALWPRYEVTTATVHFADLDLTNSKAVATLYGRIKSAADRVCESDEPPSLQTQRYVRSCTKQAIDQAVKDVSSSGLTSLHAAVTNQMDSR